MGAAALPFKNNINHKLMQNKDYILVVPYKSLSAAELSINLRSRKLSRKYSIYELRNRTHSGGDDAWSCGVSVRTNSSLSIATTIGSLFTLDNEGIWNTSNQMSCKRRLFRSSVMSPPTLAKPYTVHYKGYYLELELADPCLCDFQSGRKTNSCV